MHLPRVCILVLALLLVPYTSSAYNPNAPQLIVAGLVVNNQDEGVVDTLLLADDYFIALNKFIKIIGIAPEYKNKSIIFNTPLGAASLDKAALTRYKDNDYINIKTAKQLAITINFNQADYAIEIYLPWQNKHVANASKTNVKNKIDYRSSKSGVNRFIANMGFSQSGNQQTRSQNYNSYFGFSGHLFSGLWGAKILKAGAVDNFADDLWRLDNIFWSKYKPNFALRLGLNNPSLPIANAAQYSGIAFAYSNSNIERHAASPNSYSEQLLVNSYSDYRNVRGEGPAGGVAELRINGQPIARVRIALDKSFEFINLDVSKFYATDYKVEIALFEHAFASQPLKIIAYNLAKRDANVASDELLIEAGSGKAGNIFAAGYDKNAANYSFVYLEYGLNNNIAIRAAADKQTQFNYLFGANIGISPNFNLDFAYKTSLGAGEFSNRLAYTHKLFSAYYDYNYYLQAKQHQHKFYFTFKPNKYFNLALSSYNSRDSKYSWRYLANAKINFNKALAANINRDVDGNLAYNLNWRWNKHALTLDYDYKKWLQQIAIQHQLFANTNIGAVLVLPKYYQHAYQQFNFTQQFANDVRLFANIGKFKNQYGYQLGLNYKINNGLNFDLGYQYKGMLLDNYPLDLKQVRDFKQLQSASNNVLQQLQREPYFAYINFNLALARNAQSGYRFDNNYAQVNKGNVLLKFAVDEVDVFANQQLQVSLNQQQFVANKIANNQYLLSNVEVGIYKLSLDNLELPIEYNLDNLHKPIIEVAAVATTVVPYKIKKYVGCAGRAIGASQPITIKVLQQNQLLQTVTSNEFGYYQILALSAGDYQLVASGYKPKHISLEKDFTFEVDLEPELDTTYE